MSGRLIRTMQAIRDLEVASYNLYERNPRAALRFIENADETLRLLASNPGLGARYAPDDPRFEHLRYFALSRIKTYIVFYGLIADGIKLLGGGHP